MREANQFVRSVDSKTKEQMFGGERVNRVSGRQLTPPNDNVNRPKPVPKPIPAQTIATRQPVIKPPLRPIVAPQQTAEAHAPNASALAPKAEKQPVRGPVKIVSRDLEIIEFILDMKFASLEEVFEKFFSRTKTNEQAKSSDWARDRLSRLEQYGFLRAVPVGAPPVRHFIVTKQGYETLINFRTLEKVPKNPPNIDVRIFTHDKMVLRSRLEFEKANPEGKWISDRRLRSGMAAMFNLPSAYIPDAIYEVAAGERVAFELENALKGRSAYREKITYFAKLIASQRHDPNMFTRVRFRCVRQDVFKLLSEECKVYPNLFTVEFWENGKAFIGGEQ